MCMWKIGTDLLLVIVLVGLCAGEQATIRLNQNGEDVLKFLQDYNRRVLEIVNNQQINGWQYETNITEHNKNLTLETSKISTTFDREASRNASRFDRNLFNEHIRRQLKEISNELLSDEEMSYLKLSINEMGGIYASSKVCDDKACYGLSPELTELFANSRDYERLSWAWEQWRNVVGRKQRPLYIKYVGLKNKLAQLNGYKDYGDLLRKRYDTDMMEEQVDALYDELKPLYQLVHAYVRRKLYDVYGPEVIDLRGPLPACVLGDMWGRFWNNLYSIVQPFPEKPSIDPTPQLIRKNYSVVDMYRVAEDFFTATGMLPVPEKFWKKSMLEKPKDGREVACHATAWDFFGADDFRIKFCTDVTFDDFLTVHHEMGHIQYFLQYRHQPYLYRDGANDGFHEAIGELMAMSVSTPKHLKTIGLLEEVKDDEETDLNFLMLQSLLTVTTLPFHLSIDKWLWRVFESQQNPDTWNRIFWKLKYDLVGVAPPVSRNSSVDLDPPALFHIANDYDMMRYFTRTIMQFQFYETLCEAAGHRGPLYKCDFYGSHEAGEKLASMLRLGKSLPWPDVMEAFTGQRKMLVSSLKNYFKPLEKFLKRKLSETGDGVGWGNTWTPVMTEPQKSAADLQTRPVFLLIIGFLVPIIHLI